MFDDILKKKKNKKIVCKQCGITMVKTIYDFYSTEYIKEYHDNLCKQCIKGE